MIRRAILAVGLLVSMTVGVEGQVEASAAVRRLIEARREVMPLGRAARADLGRARRRCEDRAARALFESLRIELTVDVSPAPTADAIASAVGKFEACCLEVLPLGANGLAAVDGMVAELPMSDQPFARMVARRLVAREILTAIQPYLRESGAASGTFPGMFASLKDLPQAAGVALDVFTEADQPIPVRELAGEAVAQLTKPGDPEVMARVRSLMAESFEERAVREKAKWILCRLGDTSLLESELSVHRKRLLETMPKLQESSQAHRALVARLESARESENPDDAKKAEIARLQAEAQKATADLANLMSQVFQGHYLEGMVHLQVEHYGDAEKSFDEGLRYGEPLLAMYRGNSQLTDMVSGAAYNLACAKSRRGDAPAALITLERAMRLGYANLDWIEKDGDLQPVRALPEFEKLMKEIRSGERQKTWQDNDPHRGAPPGP